MALISVIIPAYNAGKTILETIRSVQEQTFQDFEIIIINDGSTDNTLEVLDTIQDDRLKVFSYKNGGLPTARNRGVDHANGNFISFLDADDLWTPDKLELQLQSLEQNPDAAVSYSWNACMFQEEEFVTFIRGGNFYHEGNVYSQLLLGNFIGNGSNILIRRDVLNEIGLFDPDLKSYEDWDFYIRTASKFFFVVVPHYQVLYRKMAGSMTSKIEIMETEGLRVIEQAYQIVPHELAYLKSQSLANLFYYFADLYSTYATYSVGRVEASKRLRNAFSSHPAILLNKNFIILAGKVLLRHFLPESVVNSFAQVRKKRLIIADPRF
jgi:glycosyltransferase involved in cell wall biosynthesis